MAKRIEGPVTVTAYERARDALTRSYAIIQNRCGSWINALLAAGLGDRLSAKARGKIARGEVAIPS